MGPDAAHRGVSVPPGTLSHPGTTAQLSGDISSHEDWFSVFFFMLAEAEGGLGPIHICEPVSGSQSGSLQSQWAG